MFLRLAPFLFLTLAAAPMRAQSPSPCEISVHEKMRLAIDDLKSRAEVDGFRLGSEDFDKLREEFRGEFDECDVDTPQTPETISMRARVMARIAELERKAANALLDLRELDQIEDQAIDAALDNAVGRLKYQVKIGALGDAEFVKMETALNARAAYAIGHDPEIDAVAGRLQAEIDRLIRRAQAAQEVTEDDVNGLRALVTERRAAHALRKFEDGTYGGWATQADLEDVLALVDRFPEGHRAEVRAMIDAWLEYVRGRLHWSKDARGVYAGILKELNAHARLAMAQG